MIEEGWKPLQPHEVPREVEQQIVAKDPDLSVFRSWLFGKFFEQTGRALDPNQLNSGDAKSFANWFTFQQMQSVLVLGFRKYPKLEPIFHNTYSTKVSALSQRFCSICKAGRSSAEAAALYTIPLRISPVTKQSTSPDFDKAYQNAIMKDLSTKNIIIKKDIKLCLSITYILEGNGKTKDKDLDNMTKGFQDALAKALNFNDKDIHHLDVIKIIIPKTEESITVQLSPSFLNDHVDVLAPIVNQTWAGQERIDPLIPRRTRRTQS